MQHGEMAGLSSEYQLSGKTVLSTVIPCQPKMTVKGTTLNFLIDANWYRYK
jgi:hypothetical protein